MSAIPRSQELVYVHGLIKEAVVLTDQLASMDKKKEAAIRKEKGALLVWWEENVDSNPSVKFIAGQVPNPVEKGLEAIFTRLFKLIGITAELATSASVAAVMAPFEAVENDDARVKFYDDNPEFMQQFWQKQKRLQDIYLELFVYAPPSLDSFVRVNDCVAHGRLKSMP